MPPEQPTGEDHDAGDLTVVETSTDRPVVDVPWRVIVVLGLLGQFMIVGGIGALNIALPSIGRALGSSESQLQWILVTYQLGYALMLIPSSRLGDRFGADRVLRLGLAGFITASLVASAANVTEILIAARLVQGVCGALVSPQVLTLIQRLVPIAARSTALVWYGIAAGSGWMVGQLMTGALLGVNPFALGWRSAFLIYVPLGAIALVGLQYVLRSSPSLKQEAERLDLISVALVVTTGALVMFPLIQGRSSGWPPILLVALVSAIPVAYCFVQRQRSLVVRESSPLVDLRLLAIPSFRTGISLLIVNGFIVLPNFVFLTFTVQLGFGRSPLETAAVLAPHTLGVIVASFTTRRLALRIGRDLYKYSCAFLVVGYGSMLALLELAPDVALLLLIPTCVLQGIGVGLVSAPTITYALSGVPIELASSASGVMQTTQQLSGAVGISLWGGLFFGVLGGSQDSERYVSALQVATLPVFGLIFLTFLMHLRLPAAMHAVSGGRAVPATRGAGGRR